MFFGILWRSIKQVKSPDVFDVEHGIALHAMQGNRASSLGEGEVSWFFSSCGGNLGYILKLRRGWPFKTRVCSATSGLLSSYEGQLRNLLKPLQCNADASQGEAVDPVSLSSCHSILGILSIFKKGLASSPFEALNSVCLLWFQRDERPLVQMRRGPKAFCRFSTRDSDIPSSCEKKDEPAFKRLQGIQPSFKSGYLGAIPLEAANSQSLSHTYC